VRGAERWQFDPDRSGGGILNWLGVHWFDLMRVIIAAEPIEVAALEARLGPDPVPVEDVATVGLRFSNGALGTLRIGYVTPGGDEIGMAVHGSGGWARWDVGESSLTVVSANPAWHTAPRRRFEVPVAEIGGYGAEGMAHLRAFFAVIRGEGPPDPLLPRLDDARRLLEIVEAAHESARTGRVVRLPA